MGRLIHTLARDGGDKVQETAYQYDLGRRIGKGRLKNEEVSDSLEEETGFVWDGSHLLQEVQPDGRYTYLYTDPDSYDPLAKVRNWTTADDESRQQTHYFHCDQIGTDPHAFKADYVGKRAVSYYDVYKQNKTGELLLRRKNSSEFIRTGIGCDDDLPPPTAPAKKCSSTQGKNNLITKIIGILLVFQL